MREENYSLYTVFTEVLERYAFMFSEVADAAECVVDPKQRYLHAEIGFDGPLKGSISMMATRKFGYCVAANVLGLEPDDVDEAYADDAFRELLNITCGDYLEARAGNKAVFDVGIPCVKLIDSNAAKKAVRDLLNIVIMVDDFLVVMCASYIKQPQ